MAKRILRYFLANQLQRVSRQQPLAGKDLFAVDHPHGKLTIPACSLARLFIMRHHRVHGFRCVLVNQAPAAGNGFADGDIKFGDNFFHEKIMNLLGAERLRFRLVPLIEQAALIELLSTDRIVVIDVGLAINNGRDGQHKQVVFAGEFIG